MASGPCSSVKVRLASSSAVSATRIASGRRLRARNVSSLSFRMDQSRSSPFMRASPALAQLRNHICGQPFCGEWQRLPFVRGGVGANEKACVARHFIGAHERLSTAGYETVFHMYVEIEFSCRQHVPTNETRRDTLDLRDFGLQSGVATAFSGNAKGAVLLKLFDHSVGHEHFDSRQKCLICKGRNGDRVHVAQVVRFNRADVIAKTPTQAQRAYCHREGSFHGFGEEALSGEAEASAAGEPAGVALASLPKSGSGAVVVSGRSEAGGGSATSYSGAG